MRVHQAVGQTLQRLGIEAVFGLMGDGNLRFVSQFRNPYGLAFYGTRHESCGVGMADGYARVTDRVGVCSFTQGPGLTNAMTALRTATTAHSPVLVVVGDTPRSARGHIQDVDQSQLLENVGAAVQPLDGPETVAETLTAAFERAESERRPVGVSIPTDLQDEPCPDRPMVPPAKSSQTPPAADDASIGRAVELIQQASRPVVVAGRGAALADAREALTTLADQIDAPLATSVLGKDLFRGHPFAIGIAGGFSSTATAELIGKADLVLAFGASLNYWTTRSGTLISPSARIVHCDVDPDALGALTAVDCPIVGDAAVVAGQLRRALEMAEERPPSGQPSLRTNFPGDIAREPFQDQGTEAEMDPRALCTRLDELLPAERLLAIDGGHFTGFPCTLMEVPEPAALLFGVTSGSIGQALGLALGAAVARQDRLAVAVVGDGGLMTDLGDVETAVRYELPVLIVVIDDSAYGAELHHLDLLGLPADEARFPDVDLAAVARALGAGARTVRRVEELDGLTEWLEAPRGPLLLDCKVTSAVRARWLEEAVAAG